MLGDWGKILTKTPYLVLFIVLIAIGVGTASALITITLSGDVVITGDLDMTNGKISNLITPSVPADAATKGYVDSSPTTDTLATIGCSTDQFAKFDGNNWVCVKITAQNNPISILDSVHSLGELTSIAIDVNGNPVISYFDDSSDLKVLHCGNVSCTSGNVINTIENLAGFQPSIAIGTDGNPVISYYDITNDNLKVSHCGNASCSSGNTITTVDNAELVGTFNSIAIGADGNPVVSYYDQFNTGLKILHCGNISCTSGNTATGVNNLNDIGTFTSIAIGADGNPVVSYYFETDTALRVLHCGNVSCTSGNNASTFDNSGSVGTYTSIAIGADDLPVISYYDFTNSDLRVLHCGNVSCTSGNIITQLTTTSSDGKNTSIAIGANGFPVISYTGSSTNGFLNLLYCGNALCNSGNTIISIDDSDTGLQGTSIAIGANGFPVISYTDIINRDLKVALHGVIFNFE